VRQMPGRLHGGQVLHRAAAGRARSRVRTRARREATGHARRWAGSEAERRHVQAPPSAGQALQREPAGDRAGAMKLGRNPWFESVAVAQRRAKRRLPKSVYSALIAGSEAGLTLADNTAAFRELGFAPHVGG